MKKNLAIALLLLAAGFTGYAQCDKKISWNSKKAEFLDSTGKVEDTKDENIVITISKTEMKVVHGEGENNTLSGTIKNISCNWAEPYKNGKTSFSTSLAEGNGDVRDVTVTIEAKDGKVTVLIEMLKDEKKKIKVYIDGYKEEV